MGVVLRFIAAESADTITIRKESWMEQHAQMRGSRTLCGFLNEILLAEEASHRLNHGRLPVAFRSEDDGDDEPATPARPPLAQRRGISEEQRERMVHDFQAGTGRRELAIRFGVSIISVYRILREGGVESYNQAPLTKAEAQQIVAEYVAGGMNQTELAHKFRRNNRTIARILVKHGAHRKAKACKNIGSI